MKKSAFIPFVTLAMMIGNAAVAHAAGTTPSDAGVIGREVSGIIECGQGYTSHELYDVKITVQEMTRGTKAWQVISKQDGANKPPPAGYDYILARIKVGYYARGRPGTCVHMVKRSHFTAYSRTGKPYPNPELRVPQPPLNGPLKSGESITGWAVFEVARHDSQPLMFYSVDDAGAVQHGGKLWFKLY